MERLDKIIVNRGLAESREKAQSLIMAGLVKVDDTVQSKAGHKFPDDCKIEILGKEHPYVSRGGMKLEKAIKEFQLDLNGKVILDIGASTGGFTDCALQNGAKKVYALDVGHGQLDYSLRKDDRVIVMEKFNARNITEETLPEKVDIFTIDASFISLEKIIPAALSVLKQNGEFVALIKPQFEAGKELVEKGGVIRNHETHKQVIEKIIALISQLNISIKGLAKSPIKGPKGNIEFLIYCQNNNSESINITNKIIEKLIMN